MRSYIHANKAVAKRLWARYLFWDAKTLCDSLSQRLFGGFTRVGDTNHSYSVILRSSKTGI